MHSLTTCCGQRIGPERKVLATDLRVTLRSLAGRGRVSGGSGIAIRLARHHGIPVFDLAGIEPCRAMRRFEGIAVSVAEALARRKGEDRSQVIRTGSGREAARMAPFKWVNTTLGNIKCCSACNCDPAVSHYFNSLSRRSARNPRAELHTWSVR